MFLSGLRASYQQPNPYVLKFYNSCCWIAGGLNGNLSVMCGSPPESATTVSSTTSTTTLTSTRLSHATSPIEPSTETTTTSTSVVNPIENTDATLSSSTINVSYDSLSTESKTDNPEMICKYTDDLTQCFLEICYFF